MLWGDSAFQFNGSTVRALGQTESAIVIFVGTTVRDYSGERGLAGGKACRWYINEDIAEINILRVSAIDQFKPIAAAPLPAASALQIQGDHYPTKSVAEMSNFNLFENEDAHFRCAVRVLGFATAPEWFGAFCRVCGRSSRPSSSSSAEISYVCTQPGCTSNEAFLRYQIALIATDGTDEVTN